MGSFSNNEIFKIIEKYKRDKEYRRVYYGNKYKNDLIYRQYIIDYNKIRYEERVYKNKLAEGMPEKILMINKATRLRKFYIKTDRENIFNEKHKDLASLL
tara:strand:- start:1302 stop:1601 length:300 start_codon:yes stop_codon:yes gene_type:complete